LFPISALLLAKDLLIDFKIEFLIEVILWVSEDCTCPFIVPGNSGIVLLPEVPMSWLGFIPKVRMPPPTLL
jgi:hypothetical protein